MLNQDALCSAFKQNASIVNCLIENQKKKLKNNFS